MENVFLRLLNMSLTAGLLVVAVVLLRLVFHKAPRWIHVLLWALVAVRLLCPITIESNLSLMPDTPAVSVPAPAPDTPPVENIVPDTPVVDSPTVIPPVTDDPSVIPPTLIPPVVDTPPMTVIPPVTDTPVVTPIPDASVSTATPEASIDPWQIVLTVATWAWLAGVVALAAYAVLTTLRLRRQVGEAAHLADNLWQCDHLRSPFILGVFRPRIYLPSDLSAAARESVVAHEQAHLHRRDHWWKPLGFLLLTVYWFNPLMWVAYILLCRDIEAACDERVVRDMPAADRKAYSEALLACSAPRRLVSACPLAFGETAVKNRIKSVLSYKKPTIWIIVAALLVSTVAGVCLLTDPKSDDSNTDKKSSVTDEDDTTTTDSTTGTTNPTNPTTPPQGDHSGTGMQVTGTVLEWHKEEEYLLLKVNPQFSEELGETLKVSTHYALAGCAPEVGSHLRILYDGYVEAGSPATIYAATLWGRTTYDIVETGIDLYDDLLKEIADYFYGLAPTAQEPDCNLQVFYYHKSLSEIGIKVMDLDKNEQNELLITSFDGYYGVHYVYDVYTIKDGKLVHLLTSTERSRYNLHEGGYISYCGSGGASLSIYDFYRLVDGKLTPLERVTYDADYAVESGLAPDLSSVTEDVAWFRTAYDSEGNQLGFGHITKQKAQDIIADFAADHPLLNVNFLCLETGVAGSPEDDDPPTTGTTTPPTTGSTTGSTGTTGTKPTTKPTTPTTTPPNVPHAVPYMASRTFFSYGMLVEDKLDALYQQYAYDRNSGKDLPIIPITSRTQLNAFIEKYKSGFRGGYGLPSLETLSVYGNDFFANHMLLAVYHPYHSAPAYPQIVAIDHNGSGLVTVQLDIHLPEVMNDAVGQNFVLAEVPHAQVANADFRAVVREEKCVEYRWQNYTHPVMAGSGDEFVGSTYGNGWIDGNPWQLVRYVTWRKADSTAFKTIGYFSMDDGKRYYVSLDGTTLFDGERIATLNAEQTAMMAEYIRGVAPVKADTYVTGKLVEWNQQSRYMTLEVMDNIAGLGQRVRVYTPLMSIRNTPTVGDTIAIAYDGFCERGSSFTTIYGLFLVDDGTKYVEDGYKNSNIPYPETNLEFWIAQNVNCVDFSKYQEQYGLFGGTAYYGTGYVPTVDGDGQQVDPKHCVTYTVTSYPDYVDFEQHVTSIHITDPNVYFYGISLDSSFEEFDAALIKQGFEITETHSLSHTAENGKFSITMTKDWIMIRVEVENRTGIIY